MKKSNRIVGAAQWEAKCGGGLDTKARQEVCEYKEYSTGNESIDPIDSHEKRNRRWMTILTKFERSISIMNVWCIKTVVKNQVSLWKFQKPSNCSWTNYKSPKAIVLIYNKFSISFWATSSKA